ncbi:acyl-CoA dehydrogenase family protein [Candidatus Acetothermia bacterium]|jgi:glutaryl-CoA dehydrogenase|nr:acyl-CoA dehydrogenase family protein [Candidatus Acetothermia bacterium]MCI2432482.1 acyl-CoA dehydrogenase family protein [Candidatus Acetothermia bacterium]MCI2436336.1 acyl-CoA dehydrogenase family protein [Candidatus Acetothermia bacterium]
MSSFSGVDYFDLDALLTHEQKLVRNTVRQFVDEDVLPIIKEAFEEEHFPTQLLPKIGGLGLLGATLKEYGGAGIDSIAYGLAMQELERGDSGIRSFCSVQNGLVIYPIYAFGSQEQKERWLPKLIQGEAVGCFGLTEPEHGSDPSTMETVAQRDGNYFILNGTKAWITNATLADLALVWAKLDGVIRGFLVDKGTEGFSVAKIEHKMSARASDTGELYLNDCRIPKENILGVEGLKGPLICLNQGRYAIAWGAVGAAMACYEEVVEYAKQRVQFDKPIASFQLVQEKLVEMLTEITKAQLLCFRLGQLKEEGKAKPVQISLAKRNNVAMALKIARLARDLLGANGITLDYQSIRHMLNLESVYTLEGTHHVQTLILGQDITGIQAFK